MTIDPHDPGFADAGIVDPVPLRGLHGHLLELLGTRIADGSLKPGEQIVPELIAQSVSVSRTVVREVLKVLESKGLVTARQRKGTRVSPEQEWNVLDPDVIRWRSIGPSSARQLSELLALRGAVEPLAARTASTAASEDDLRALDECAAKMDAAVTDQDWSAFTNADVTFHRALLHASGSLAIDRIADPIEAAIRVRHQLRLIPKVLSHEMTQRHRDIVDAIRNHDSSAAEAASRQLVDVAGDETMITLSKVSSESAAG
ncbi:FadR family transcriptional regulator [Planctomonas sp. JC2975]|uniref:FCD domain-containing protein n=1 Tax=Planctomonas sp. JC2975 TaxID=2729626 RepID=UPI001473CF84|nr:FadR family transcriptional regulator [Planctomonas sp. JC2975]